MNTVIIFFAILLVVPVIGFGIIARQTSSADRREQNEFDGTDEYLIQSAQSVTPAQYPKSARTRDMPEPMGM